MMLAGRNENHGVWTGEVMGEPEFSHENHGEDFFRIPLRILRLSQCGDEINLLVPRGLLDKCAAAPGARVRAEGEVRSYNNRTGPGSRLVISAFARRLEPGGPADENRVTAAGVVCKAPVYRRTPLGREICDIMLAVNRRYGRADYLPCIAWGSLAQRCGELPVGAGLRLTGRLQSRSYTKKTPEGTEERTAFELSIMELELEDT